MLPIVVPNLPHIKMIQTAIALTFVGKRATAPLEITEMETPDSTKKHENDVTVIVGSVNHKRANPEAPETNKQNAEIFFLLSILSKH